MKEATSPAVQRLTWIRWSCTTALGLSLWCATAALAFDAQGHRGARGLAPENTLAAFDRALSIGVTTLELDVVLSAEGVPVISHDTTPNPDLTRDAGGRWLQARGQPFNRLTLAEIAEWDVGRINPSTRYARDFAEQVAQGKMLLIDVREVADQARLVPVAQPPPLCPEAPRRRRAALHRRDARLLHPDPGGAGRSRGGEPGRACRRRGSCRRGRRRPLGGGCAG